jgi:hypothetical protein
MDENKDYSIVCVGHARLPEGVPGQEKGIISIGLEIDTSGEIIDASSTLVTEKGRAFIASLLIGHNILNDGIEGPIVSIERRYFATGKKSIISAVRDAYKRFQESRLTVSANSTPQNETSNAKNIRKIK